MVDKMRSLFPPEKNESKKTDKTKLENSDHNSDSKRTFRDKARRGGVWVDDGNKASLGDNPIHRLPNENLSNPQKQSHEAQCEAIDKFIHNSLTSFTKSAKEQNVSLEEYCQNFRAFAVKNLTSIENKKQDFWFDERSYHLRHRIRAGVLSSGEENSGEHYAESSTTHSKKRRKVNYISRTNIQEITSPKDRASIQEITSPQELTGYNATNTRQAQEHINNIKSNYSNELDKKLPDPDKRTLRAVVKQAKKDINTFASQLHQDQTAEALSTLQRMSTDANTIQKAFNIKYYNTAINNIKLEKKE